MKRPDTLAEVLAATAEDARFWTPAWAGYLDPFYMAPERRQAMIDPEPPMTDTPCTTPTWRRRAEHLARRWDLANPAWTANPARTLHEPHFAGGIEAPKPLLLAQSPLAFRKRMIFVEHERLSRARMPRAEWNRRVRRRPARRGASAGAVGERRPPRQIVDFVPGFGGTAAVARLDRCADVTDLRGGALYRALRQAL